MRLHIPELHRRMHKLRKTMGLHRSIDYVNIVKCLEYKHDCRLDIRQNVVPNADTMGGKHHNIEKDPAGANNVG